MVFYRNHVDTMEFFKKFYVYQGFFRIPGATIVFKIMRLPSFDKENPVFSHVDDHVT